MICVLCEHNELDHEDGECHGADDCGCTCTVFDDDEIGWWE